MEQGTFLGRYKLGPVLGSGAMGEVYQATDPKLNGRKVAIKTILKSRMLDPKLAAEYSERFDREAAFVSSLTHPNIVTVHDFGNEAEVAYLVMEFIDGKELKTFLDAKHVFAIDETVRIVCQLLEALAYAHDRFIFHRDIKPANIMIDGRGWVKLTDFGVARQSDANGAEATMAGGTLVGTPSYMSPEQIKGIPAVAASDLFATGVVLYQCLALHKPFVGESSWEIWDQTVNKDPPPLSTHRAGVPPALERAMLHALAKNPKERPVSALAMIAELKAAIAGESFDPDATRVVSSSGGGARDDSNSLPMRTRGGSLAGQGGVTSGFAAATGAARDTLTHQNSEIELEFWRSIKDSGDIEEFQLFLERFPSGNYSDLARRKMSKLAGSATATTGLKTAAGVEDTDASVAQQIAEQEEKIRRLKADQERRIAEAARARELQLQREEEERQEQARLAALEAERVAEEAARRAREEEVARIRAAEAEAARIKAAEEEAARIKVAEEAAARAKAAEEAAARIKAAEEAAARVKAAEEVAARIKAAEKEAQRIKAAEEEAARVKAAEEAAARVKAAEKEAQRVKAAEEEAQRVKAAKEAARIKAAEEVAARIKAAEEEAARVEAAEEAARVKAEEEEAARVKAAEEAAARAREAEEAAARLKVAEEEARCAAREAKKRAVQEQAAIAAAAEQARSDAEREQALREADEEAAIQLKRKKQLDADRLAAEQRAAAELQAEQERFEAAEEKRRLDAERAAAEAAAAVAAAAAEEAADATRIGPSPSRGARDAALAKAAGERANQEAADATRIGPIPDQPALAEVAAARRAEQAAENARREEFVQVQAEGRREAEVAERERRAVAAALDRQVKAAGAGAAAPSAQPAAGLGKAPLFIGGAVAVLVLVGAGIMLTSKMEAPIEQTQPVSVPAAPAPEPVAPRPVPLEPAPQLADKPVVNPAEQPSGPDPLAEARKAKEDAAKAKAVAALADQIRAQEDLGGPRITDEQRLRDEARVKDEAAKKAAEQARIRDEAAAKVAKEAAEQKNREAAAKAAKDAADQKLRDEEKAKATAAAVAPKAKPKADPDSLFAQAQRAEQEGRAREAVEFYKQAYGAGSGRAARMLGDMYGRGSGEVSRDYGEQLQWYEKAKAMGVDVPTPGKRKY